MATQQLTKRRTAFRFSAELFLEMAEQGMFGENGRVELIDGEILTMPAIEMPHATSVALTTEVLTIGAAGRALAWPQLPIRAFGRNVPQPDVGLVTRRRYTRGKPPEPEDIFLIVEVADTSLKYDTTDKMVIYARSLIREYWVVDLNHQQVLVHRDPVDGRYHDIRTYKAGERVSVLAFPDIVVAIDDILA